MIAAWLRRVFYRGGPISHAVFGHSPSRVYLGECWCQRRRDTQRTRP